MFVAFLALIAILLPLTVRGLRTIPGGSFAPAAIVGPVLLIEYVIRPLYVLRTGEWSPGSGVRLPIEPYKDALTFAAIAVTLFVLAYCVGDSTGFAEPVLTSEDATRGEVFSLRSSIAISGLWAVGLATSYSIYSASSGSGLQARFTIDSGYRLALTSLAWAPSLAALAVGARSSKASPRWILSMVLLAFSGLTLNSLMLGGRADAVIALVALAVILVRRSRKVSLRVLAVGGLVTLIALASFRIQTRENSGSAISGLLEDPVGSVMRSDVNAFDKLLAVEYNDLTGTLAGESYLHAALVAVPQNVVEVATESASNAYTREVLPSRYRLGVGFEGSSSLGEAVMNFGLFGGVVFGAFLGVLLRILHRYSFLSAFGLFAYAVVLGRIPGIVRGDLTSVLAVLLPALLWGGLTIALRGRTWEPSTRRRLAVVRSADGDSNRVTR